MFRADASEAIGTGHVMRCLTLGQILRDKGAAVHFVCREHRGHLCGLIEQRGFDVARLPLSFAASAESRVPMEWLGASCQTDAEETLASIRKLGVKPDWLIADHYAIDQSWEQALRPHVDRILIIDDMANRSHDCDLLLDQNLVANLHDRYQGRVPSQCRVLLGPHYALLEPIYERSRSVCLPRSGPIKRILIFFGGADRRNLTGMALQAFLNLGREDIEVDVVTRSGSPHAKYIHSLAAGRGNIHEYQDLPSLAPLMAKADLAIGAGGATSWERLCLGLPAIVITLAENQCAIAKELANKKLIRLIGKADSSDIATLQAALTEVVEKGLDNSWSERCFEIVDGKGRERVAAAILSSGKWPLRARRASVSDELLLLQWANDEDRRRNALSNRVITPDEHHQWLESKLHDEDGCRLFIVETSDAVPVGQVRFQRCEETTWEIHYSLGERFRGQGLANALLATALDAMKGDRTCREIIARVKKGNVPSCRALARVGFKARACAQDMDVVELRLER